MKAANHATPDRPDRVPIQGSRGNGSPCTRLVVPKRKGGPRSAKSRGRLRRGRQSLRSGPAGLDGPRRGAAARARPGLRRRGSRRRRLRAEPRPPSKLRVRDRCPTPTLTPVSRWSSAGRLDPPWPPHPATMPAARWHRPTHLNSSPAACPLLFGGREDSVWIYYPCGAHLNPRIAGSIPDEQAVEGTVGTDGRAIRFIVLLGVVSLFADMAYEGGRSIIGPFLGAMGAGGTVVGVLSGFGELAGYGVRFVSGRVADRSRRYWSIATSGYAINLLAVPALALAGSWPVAACLVIAERVGKGIRTPARDALLAHASTRAGSGHAFGLHEALDQIGAVAGPLGVSAILAFSAKGYRPAFAALVVPVVVALVLLRSARRTYPDPSRFETGDPAAYAGSRHPAFVPYLLAACLIAAGFADYPLIAFHLQARSRAAHGVDPRVLCHRDGSRCRCSDRTGPVVRSIRNRDPDSGHAGFRRVRASGVRRQCVECACRGAAVGSRRWRARVRNASCDRADGGSRAARPRLRPVQWSLWSGMVRRQRGTGRIV